MKDVLVILVYLSVVALTAAFVSYPIQGRAGEDMACYTVNGEIVCGKL